uniref:CBM20 domain-containing protein n=1 Tax=Chromera velia CCMP2878 TaxID=1169474 RepID=A0A0G4FYW5_9ALVE|eukprot:Cvel_19463.t1-p1 / transcript=Cvel_19463.t1 / gene=Cvel_19463 / organism=Chromera_velia_CCMP2878 / gene_product=Zinc finger protein 420, putative / transcript_product=Zinc finger protein 420, putative / location=Cvel_scaffold1679:29169-31827(-) / protein_length=842 / sequence_SO=supercontig / SO=protein_coding / is_pseudo=false
MTEVETGGGVVFACTGVEPREGQTLVVVGSSSELGGWDVSRGITLQRVKNPAFPGVWMSFPMFHSASSQVLFQFALVGPSASHSSVGGSLVDSPDSFEVASAITVDASTEGRSGDLWEPLGCGLREVEVVDGGLVLFGGRWGEGGTQVTPLTWEDMVQAQQELEQDSLPDVSSEHNAKDELQRAEVFRGGDVADTTAEADKVPHSLSTLPSVHSSPCPTFASSHRWGGRRISQPVQCPPRRSRASGQQGGGRSGQLPKRQIGETSVACIAVAPDPETPDTLMASVESVQEGDGVPSRWGGGRFEIPPVSECLQGGGYGVMRGRRGDGVSDQALRFGPAALTRGDGMGGEEDEMLGGKIAENVSGLTGGYDSVFVPSLLVGKRQQIPREPPTEEQSMSAVVEGPKRRRLLCVSPAVSASHSDMRGGLGAEASVRERSLSTGVFATVPKEQSRSQESRASFDSVALSLGVHCTKAFQGDRVCRLVEKGKRERRLTERGGASENGKGSRGVIDKSVNYPHVELKKWEGAQVYADGLSFDRQSEYNRSDEKEKMGRRVTACGGTSENGKSFKEAERANCPQAELKKCESAQSCEEGLTSSRQSEYNQQHHVCAAGARGDIGLRGGGKKRECTGEVKRDRGGNILYARNVEEETSVSTVVSGIGAEIAGGRASVSTVEGVISARSAGGRGSVSTVGSGTNARSAGGRGSVSTVASALSARIAEGRVFVNTADSALSARIAAERASASMVASALSARSVEGQASASTAVDALSARIAAGGGNICEHGRLDGRQRYYCQYSGGKGIGVHRRDGRFCQEFKRSPPAPFLFVCPVQPLFFLPFSLCLSMNG